MKTVVHISENSEVAATRAFRGIGLLAGDADVDAVVLVANGGGVAVLLEESKHAVKVREALADGHVSVRACAAALRTLDRSPDDLVPGVELAERGGVVELTALQDAGYAYVKVP